MPLPVFNYLFKMSKQSSTIIFDSSWINRYRNAHQNVVPGHTPLYTLEIYECQKGRWKEYSASSRVETYFAMIKQGR
jgi:hypothetical protein